MYHPTTQETDTVVKRIFSALSNPAGGYKIKCPDEILAVTKLGSRLWGTYNYQSDYDCLVIHTNNAKNVKHVGATIAAKEIDVRLESTVSMVEQMKAGSVRCWLSFLLLIADNNFEEQQQKQHQASEKAGKNEKTNTTSNDENDDNSQEGEEEEEQQQQVRHTSLLFPNNSHVGSHEKLNGFIRFVISAVSSLDKNAMMSKLSETLAEDEQRVLKMLAGDESRDKARKIMKHSLRLVFSTNLIYDAMKPKEDNNNNNNNNDDSQDKGGSKKKTSAANNNNKNNARGKTNNNSQNILNGFSPTLDLEKHVFAIEDKINALVATPNDANFGSCFLILDDESNMTSDAVGQCYQSMMMLLPSEWRGN